MRKVFLSSTFRDLIDYRKALCDAVEGLDGYYCVRMELFGARDWEASAFCQSKVSECDLFIGVLGHLHGSCPQGSEQSYTEHEYDAAVTAGISRLMFVAPDDFDLPVNLREPDTKWQRQEAFRQRVSQEQIRDTFGSPQDLAFKVIKAIRNWELEQPRQRNQNIPVWNRRENEIGGPHFGPLVSKMCDRSFQEDEFSESFSLHVKKNPEAPQMYLLRGEENERAVSLIERLVRTTVQKYANHKWGEQRGVISEKGVDWPPEGDPAQRQQRLLSWLFRQFDPAYEFINDDYSPTAFTQLPALRLNALVVLQHEIQATQWDRELLDGYLRFWDAIAGLSPKPQFLVFFSVLYPPESAHRSWRTFFKQSRFDKRRIEKDLMDICRVRQDGAPLTDGERCPCILIKELECIERDEVMKWFRRHKVYDDWNIWQRKCNEIFKDSRCRNMADIESELRLVHREFVTKGQQL